MILSAAPVTDRPRNDTGDFHHLFLNDFPLMDVRAPVEFENGSFPAAFNLPLLSNDERHRIGITYKNEGQDAAIKLGHKLVSGDIKLQRLKSWSAFAKEHPNGYLFCFRGGMRSHIVQEWMKEEGINYPLVKGGYKAMRRFLIEKLDHLVATKNFIVISGRTGIGKTQVIQDLQNSIDLEGLARHRGSSFGQRLTPQPCQIDFENALAIRLMKVSNNSESPIFFEDEGHIVGKCALPLSLLAGLRSWPVVMLEETLEKRISNVQKDYVTNMLTEYNGAYGQSGFKELAAFLRNSLHRIRKRLGGVQYEKISSLMNTALSGQELTGDDSLHRLWIEELLVKYYDPMYEYQFSQKEGRVLFKGGHREVLEWCRQYVVR
ncbi:MAG: tRNA 2-selenouridine(34) synthase MnmH [bacterium]|nr:tRNA 2-selenouridine(34) synthase MnmH [bacterium]MDI1229470.1 tRNA 2-selenouridine(34) synthase MnmH [bacterium]